MKTGYEFCVKLLTMPVWIKALMHCTIYEMIRDKPQDPSEFNQRQPLRIRMDKPRVAIATPSTAELNNIIKQKSYLPFTTTQDAYYYANTTRLFDSVEAARQEAGCTASGSIIQV